MWCSGPIAGRHRPHHVYGPSCLQIRGSGFYLKIHPFSYVFPQRSECHRSHYRSGCFGSFYSHTSCGGAYLKWRYRGYPVIVRGLVMTGECSPHRGVWGETWSRTTPCQSVLNRVAPRCIILSGGLQSNPRLEWSSSRREGRVQLHGGKLLLELPTSSPQILLLDPLTSCQDLTGLRDAYAFHSPPSKVSHPGGDVSYRLTGGYGLADQKTCPRVSLFPIKGQHVSRHA